MHSIRIAAPVARTGARRVRLATASLVSATTLIMFSAGAAQAHHGFDDFDTERLYYISGTVSQVRWGEPHSYFSVTVDRDLPADTPERDLPEGLRDAADSDPIDAAPSYSGSHDELEVTIAPPSFTGMWGLDRELNDGERIEAVGYVGKSHDDEFRPVVFWYEEGKPVNQVLNEELPARPLPVPYPQGDAPSADAGQESTSASADSDGTSPIAVWATLGGVLVAVVAGGAFYLRRRSPRA
ncbi:DUF6152 family protein [Streptomyces sp. DSM 3412]|uniref:DUF6152 family protein n=1 Tax=Streptomyces gottesmaniae TaxID=3075518 RepID=A0ABU2Z0Z3_9ACTN|nr:DUF6152 family protein [Streptomyces sp. DSM 3412]MDT0570251.1 DUF6152 family protein [Streptomyces sp. DSM 3412]